MSTSSEYWAPSVGGPTTNSIPESVTESIREALSGLRFGQLTIMVHDGEVVQIDRVVRTRPYRSPRGTGN
ncbi:MAG: putative small protein [Planctomycetaceae bacterium]|nr:putative small protein [Planctomycetaceae bacterium]